MKVEVRAPASSANLGPGFDCLGLALEIWANVSVETAPGLSSRPAGGAERLILQGVEAAFESVGAPPNLRLRWDEAIPVARGLGASAALRAAGLLAGNALLDGLHDTETLLALGTRLEGHPDNMAPALLGGLQVAVRAGERVLHVAAGLPPSLKVVVFVPEFEMPTQESRRRLPRQLSREDAVFNLSRAALLVAALSAGRFDLLHEATQDRIHQPVRGEIFKGFAPIMAAALEGGAAAAYLSGGGSTVAALVESDEERVAARMAEAAAAHGLRGRSIVTAPASRGAYILAG